MIRDAVFHENGKTFHEIVTSSLTENLFYLLDGEPKKQNDQEQKIWSIKN